MNYILYGKENSSKYAYAIEMIRPYSKTHLNYKRKLEVSLNDHKYYFHLSDAHFEVDFELLGTNEYNIWLALYQQIQTICKEVMGKCFILCKNFHCIKDELLDIFYIFLRDPNIQFIFCTRHISCFPDSLKHKCEILCLKHKCPQKKHIQLCEPVIDLIYSNKIDYFLLRECLYNWLTYNLNIHECFYALVSEMMHRGDLTTLELEEWMPELLDILVKYNNNYRTIYHLERFVLYLILKRKNIKHI